MLVADIIANRVDDRGVWTDTTEMDELKNSASRQTTTLCGKINDMAVVVFKIIRHDWIGSAENSCILNQGKLYIYNGNTLRQTISLEKEVDSFLDILKQFDAGQIQASFWNIGFHGHASNDNLREWSTQFGTTPQIIAGS